MVKGKFVGLGCWQKDLFFSLLALAGILLPVFLFDTIKNFLSHKDEF